ncbi:MULTISPECIES: DUF2269 domain-containing protein [unclassified Caballeronia]|uniref:DUF2269 family protein n=1 Tax=unclassified Caballeronia TaxID=2646786 RepID=UPI002854DE55|nr:MULTISPECIES: DUF2269 domain-containing protein [unclassified Caballeronia]MDR5740797.1 DUF2269 domain-containing protein [Caballeronia sp. LZ016]MDR5808682.1 DUF2269 domain-containing protein [Caballeronia sp. LZ019]
MTYLIIKWVHVLSSTILFGTGIGSAFYLLSASLGRDARTVARVSRLVVLADWLFTTPTAIIQPLTGYLMMRLVGFPMQTPWLAWSIGLYVFAIACWLPVVWLQVLIAAEARDCAASQARLSRRFWRLMAIWTALGVLAFVAFLAIFWLMVTKTL